MPEQPGRLPPREVWEGVRGVIYDLYLVQNRPLGEVAASLNNDFGLGVSVRQIKSKIKEWRFDQKKTVKKYYHAMLVVGKHLLDVHGSEASFQVPKRDTIEVYSFQRIKKEVDRQKNPEPPMTFHEAATILKDEGYRWTVPNPAVGTSNLSSNAFEVGQNLSDELEAWHLVTSDDDNEEDDGSSPVCMEMDSPDEPQGAIRSDERPPARPFNSLASRYAATDLRNISFLVPTNYQAHLGHSTSSPPEPRTTLGFIKNLATLPSRNTRTQVLSIVTTANVSHCQTCPNACSHQDFDFFPEAVGDLPANDRHKSRVRQWASPYFWNAFGDRPGLHPSKAAAIETLKGLLARDFDNQYIFPCLSWMIMTLGTNGKNAELGEFLTASCAVVDDATQNNPRYSSVFHYALAAYNHNKSEMRKYGAHFERLHEQMKLLWGKDHPNVLVGLSFWAWELLDEGHFGRAIEILDDSLPIFERVMGPHDLLTINCRVILSRAYEETYDYARTVYHLGEAIRFIAGNRREFKALSLELHGRLADLKLQLRDFYSAEQHLVHCIEGRLQLFGPEDRPTWHFIDRLVRVLEDNGRQDDVNSLLCDLQTLDGHSEPEMKAMRDRLSYRRTRGSWDDYLDEFSN